MKQFRSHYRREFLQFLSASPLFVSPVIMEWDHGLSGIRRQDNDNSTESDVAGAKNVFEIRQLGTQRLTDIAMRYCDGGADDLKTVRENSDAFDRLQIRARRLVNVKNIDTSVTVFGKQL